MAWVTTLGPSMAQIDYRLKADAGCSLTTGDDAQVDYRMDSDRPLEWVGDGLREVGIEPGTALDDAGVEAARALANGRHPLTGKVLVAPKMAVHPDAKLDAAPLVDALRKAAADAGTSTAKLLADRRMVARFERLQRGVARAEARTTGTGPAAETVAHRAPVGDLEALAAAAKVDLGGVYEAGELSHARRFRDARVVVGNRGYDLTLDLPKSYSVLMALAPAELAGELEDAYLGVARETVTAMQGWAGYGMRGHHGDGQTGTRVEGTGLLGWMTVHRTARPTPGEAPDPHLHAHITLLNLVRGTDGKWSTIGAGGRDVHRHAHAADAYMKARLRQVTRERWGIEWARDERTGAWEIATIPRHLREQFSKRAVRVETQLRAAGLDPEHASTAQAKEAAAESREAKLAPGSGGDLRAEWRRQAVAEGVDPDRIVADSTPGPDPSGPAPMPAGQVAAHVFRPEEGLTAHRKVTTRADVLAAAIDAQPGGVTDLGQAEQLADAVLQEPVVVALPPAGAAHMSNAQRYTSTDIVGAERAVLAAARDRFAGGYATVDADVLTAAVTTFETANGFALSAEQRAVLQRLATGGHGVDAIVGVAGAGKTTIMAALRSAYEATGQTVGGAATAAVAAQNLQAEAGIESRTVASWLARISDGPGLAGVDVLVVDEAAMVDDRHMALLLQEAGRTGTKVVAIGDPQQLRAVGVGGTFAAVHEMVNGLTLTDNRRQRDVDERAALATWRDQQRRAALQTWADTGRLHVTDTAEQAHEAMAERWDELRRQWTDPHERIERLLMLAHTNADVTLLNDLARARRAAAGELGAEYSWRLTGGGTVTLGVGDVVMTRTNDRSLGVLNGYRGVVVDVDDTGRVCIERRHAGPDGPELVRAWVPAGYVHRGGVQLAYAITAAKSQGLTTDQTLVYGNAMDAYVLYPAMSRDRHRVDLFLALNPLEDDADRARHGAPRNDAEARARAVAAYADALERDRPDALVLTELGQAPDPIRPADRTPSTDQREAAERLLRQVQQVTADVRRTAEAVAATGDVAQARSRVAHWDTVAARLAELPDTALRAEPTQLERIVWQRRAGQDPAGYRAAEQGRRRAMRAELDTIAAGGQPSGQYPRSELTALAGQLRAAAVRREQEAQLRDAVAQSQQIPAGARTDYVDWTRRPYGALPGDELAAQIRAAEAEAARLTASARRHQETAERLAQAAAAGDGRSMQGLRDDRAQLVDRVAAGARAAQLRAAEAAARETAQRAWSEVRELDAQARRNPIALRLAGTSRDEIAARQTELRAAAAAAAREADQHSRNAGQAERAAGGHLGGQRASAELTTLDQQWDTHAANARASDQRAADRRAGHAGLELTAAEQHTKRADGLRQEAQLRERLDPLTGRVEDLARTVEQTRQQTARAEQRAATREAALREGNRHAHYDQHRHGPDHGPSL